MLAGDSRGSSISTDGSLGIVTYPAFEPEIRVAMARNASLWEPTRLEALAREILDQTVNCGDSRELLTSTSDFPGIAGSPDITSEDTVAMVRNTPLVEPAMLDALAREILDQTVNCGDSRE